MKIIMFFVMFLFIGAFFIISNNALSLSQEGNMQKFLSLYKSWLFSITGNLLKTTGYMVKLDWLPK